jgi:hypothetical protein
MSTKSLTVRGLLATPASIHRYLRPDGTLGASGRPDPKRLVEGGVKYFCRTEEPN